MSEPTKFYLFRRNNGIYYIGYFEEGRRRWKSTGCTTKADALSAFSRFREHLRAKPVEKFLSAFISEFLAHAQATCSRGTAELYRLALDDLLTVTGDVPLTSVTPQHADRFKAVRLSKVSPVSVNVALRTLRAAMNTAVRWKLLENNPFKGLRLYISQQMDSCLSSVGVRQCHCVLRVGTTLRESALPECVPVPSGRYTESLTLQHC